MALNYLSSILSQSADPNSRWDTTAPAQNVQSAWGGYGQSAPQDVLDYFKGFSPTASWSSDPSQFGGWYADSQNTDPSKRYYTDKNGFLWMPQIDGSNPTGESNDGSAGVLGGYRMGPAPGEKPGLIKGVNHFYDPSGKYKYTSKDDPGWLKPATGLLAVATFGLGAQALAAGGEAGAIGAAGAGSGAGAGEGIGSLAGAYGAGSTTGAGFGQIGLGAGAGSAGAGYGAGLGVGSTYGGSAIGSGLASGAAGGAAGSLAAGYGDVAGSPGFGDIGLGTGSSTQGAGYNFGGSTYGGSSIGGGLDASGAAGATGVISDGTPNTASMGNTADVAGTPPPANPYAGTFGKLGGAMGDFSWTDLIGPATQLYNGAQGAKAAENASAAQLTAAREAMALSQPWREKGVGALNKLSVMLGLEGQGDPSYGALTKDFKFTQDDPSYQFRLQQGLKALKNSYAGKGRFLSGGAMKGINDYAQGAASQEYGQAFNRDLATRTNLFNRFSSLAGTGQTASNVMGDLNTQGGNAKAAGEIGSANAMSNGITGAYNTYTQNELMRRLLGGY